MIDKAKLEKIKKLADAMYDAAFNLTTDASLLKKAMDDYHQFIINEYHKEEPVSGNIDFEQELYKAFGQVKDFTLGMQIAKWFFKAGAQRQEKKDQETIETAIHHAYHNGRLEMKEQMMAKAVDAELLEGHLIRKKEVTHPLHAGDKVKLIVIKEDEL